MKQTALELLKQRLIKDQQIFPIYTEYINGILYDIDNELLEMEKQKIVEHHTWLLSGVMGEESAREDAEQYYNETYKGK